MLYDLKAVKEMETNNTKEVKCVVWDLDNTIWNGILLEDKEVSLKPSIINIIEELDSRGILQSISSKNDYDVAMHKLEEFGICKYFLYPEINWNPKSIALEKIQKNLNIGMDTILFIDDQEYERDEVSSVHKDIWCLDAVLYEQLLSFPRLNPRFITEDSKRRRLMYLEDIKRKKDEESYQGPAEKFLYDLNMQFSITEAKEQDLKRAEELTVRTNQLNATGKTYDYEELLFYSKSDKYKLLVCELTDRYGSYGKIGLALVETSHKDYWHLKLLLMSCRVMSRGVGSILLTYIMQEAKKCNKKLLANFKDTGKNRQMYITYKFSNFKEKYSDKEGNIIFENDLDYIQEFPKYINIELP